MAKQSLNRVGRKVGNVVVVRESGEGGMRKMRCPLTQQLAVPTRRADGTKVFRTKNGSEFTSRKF